MKINLSFKEWFNLIEAAQNPSFAYVNNAVIIPAEHFNSKGVGKLHEPADEATKAHCKAICEKYGYWYEGKGESGAKGNGPEVAYCKNVLGVPNPKNNGSYDDLITMDGYFAGVPAFSSIEANWNSNKGKIRYRTANTIGDALRQALANGASTFAKGDVNVKLQPAEIDQIFAVVEKDFPGFQQKAFKYRYRKSREAEFYKWMLEAERKMWESPGSALSKLGDEAETDRERKIVEVATKGGVFFLGSGHFARPVIQNLPKQPTAWLGQAPAQQPQSPTGQQAPATQPQSPTGQEAPVMQPQSPTGQQVNQTVKQAPQPA